MYLKKKIKINKYYVKFYNKTKKNVLKKYKYKYIYIFFFIFNIIF